MNIANQLTFSRIFIVPFFIVCLLWGGFYPWIGAFLLFGAAALTDWYDGKLARKYGLVSNFGKFLDPIADKLLVSSAFVCFIQVLRIPAWMVIIILSREFVISGLRSLAASKGVVLAALPIGKAKTFSQMVSITFILLVLIAKGALVKFWGISNLMEFSGWRYYVGGFLHYIPWILVFAVSVFTLFSGIMYLIHCKEIIYESIK